MVIPEIPIELRPPSDSAKAAIGFKYAGADSQGRIVGERSKFGGTPDWLQSDSVPNCSHCRTPMTFYAQLDSIGDSVCIADCGMIYIFLCFDCFQPTAIVHSG